MQKGIIKVYEGSEDNEIDPRRFKDYALEAYEGFDLDYIVYKELREKGFIVLPGIKFGCEYAVYEKGPGIDHAPYMVSVKDSRRNITSTDIVRAGRLATSVRKRFIIAIPNLETGQVQYLIFKWFKA